MSFCPAFSKKIEKICQKYKKMNLFLLLKDFFPIDVCQIILRNKWQLHINDCHLEMIQRKIKFAKKITAFDDLSHKQGLSGKTHAIKLNHILRKSKLFFYDGPLVGEIIKVDALYGSDTENDISWVWAYDVLSIFRKIATSNKLIDIPEFPGFY